MHPRSDDRVFMSRRPATARLNQALLRYSHEATAAVAVHPLKAQPAGPMAASPRIVHTVNGDRELIGGLLEAAARLAESIDDLADEGRRLRKRVPLALCEEQCVQLPPPPQEARDGQRFLGVVVWQDDPRRSSL